MVDLSNDPPDSVRVPARRMEFSAGMPNTP